jgi:hypothetical protein
MVMPMQDKANETIKVRVLYGAGCANTAPTITLIEAATAELGLGIELSETVIDSSEQARAHSFYGSPTVQVNGRDVEVAVRGSQTFGLT